MGPMGRGKEKQRPAIGRPERVPVMSVAGGWAMSVIGVGCGRPDARIADAERGKTAVTETVTALAGDHHGPAVETDLQSFADGSRAGHVREGLVR